MDALDLLTDLYRVGVVVTIVVGMVVAAGVEGDSRERDEQQERGNAH